MLDVERPGGEVRRDRVLTDSELVAVWSAAEQMGWPYGHAIRLLILTAARREEIWQLRWDEIHGDEIRLPGPRTKTGHKTGQMHIIPISSAALRLLQSVPRFASSDYVFGSSKPAAGNWAYAKRRLDAIAQIAPWRIHDLRRTTATGLERLGTPLQVTEAILGHVSGSKSGIVGIYQRHSFAAEKRAALEKWGEQVMSATV
jgi:integrase